MAIGTHIEETIKVLNENYNQILSIIYLHIFVNVLYKLKGLGWG